MNSLFNKLSKCSLILYFSFFLMFFSCVSKKKEVSVQPNLEVPRQHYAQGHFQKAIEGYSEALKRFPDESMVLENFSQVLEEIDRSADKAFQAEDYATAEQRYSLLLRNFSSFQTLEKRLSFDPEYLGHRIKDCLIARSKGPIQITFDAGDFMNALETYKLAIRAFPEENSLKQNLFEAVQELHKSGEKALEEKAYAAAGKMYTFLLNELQWIKNLEISFSFSSKSLEEGIKQCRIQLTRKGLELYRKKKLKEAISVWKSILEFDPENAEIKKAIGNAEEQMKKIKK
jgi:tetratricopeptide (TPR) repeat protein